MLLQEPKHLPRLSLLQQTLRTQPWVPLPLMLLLPCLLQNPLPPKPNPLQMLSLLLLELQKRQAQPGVPLPPTLPKPLLQLDPLLLKPNLLHLPLLHCLHRCSALFHCPCLPPAMRRKHRKVPVRIHVKMKLYRSADSFSQFSQEDTLHRCLLCPLTPRRALGEEMPKQRRTEACPVFRNRLVSELFSSAKSENQWEIALIKLKNCDWSTHNGLRNFR